MQGLWVCFGIMAGDPEAKPVGVLTVGWQIRHFLRATHGQNFVEGDN